MKKKNNMFETQKNTRNMESYDESNVEEYDESLDCPPEEEYFDPLDDMEKLIEHQGKLIEHQKETIAKQEKDIESWNNKYMYSVSDFENYKRNAIKERSNITKYGSERVVKDILPIIDDFERAFEHITDESAKQGMTLIYNKFINVLNKHNVSLIFPEKGETFTEDYHEAVSAVPAPSDELKNTVVQCIEKGYMLEDKVIRYAKVVVYN